MKDVYHLIDDCIIAAHLEKTIHMDFETFREYYYSTSPTMAQRLAVTNGVSYAQTQIWLARLDKGVDHLAFN